MLKTRETTSGFAWKALCLWVGLALFLASCSSPGGFPSISGEQRQAESEFQVEIAGLALRDALQAVNEARAFSASLEIEKNTTIEELNRERAELASREESLSRSKTLNEELTARLESNQEKLEKLDETHERLQRMAQETLGEVSALRQSAETMQGEKENWKQLAASRDRRITELSREIDNIRGEMLRRATAVQVSRSEGKTPPPPPVVATDAESTAEEKSVAKVQNEPVTGELDFQAFFNGVVALVQQRYATALEGEVVWDAVDVTIVSVAGGLLIFVFVALFFYFRMRYLKKTVGRLRKQMRRRSRAPEVNIPERRVVETSPTSAYLDQTMPEDFSPIFRSSARDDEEEFVPVTEGADFLNEEAAQETRISDPESVKPPPRRVIGALYDDEETAHSGETSGLGSPEGPATASYLDEGAEETPEAFSETQVISDAYGLDSTPQPEDDPSAGGSQEEQDLLDELKSIINKSLGS